MDEKILADLGTQVKGVAADLEKVRALPDEIAAVKAEIANSKERGDKTAAQLDTIAKDVAEYRKALEHSLGKSGSTDFRRDLGNFIKAVYHVQRKLPIPEYLKGDVSMVTDSDAAGGYLVPVGVADEVTKLTYTHGQIWPHLKKVTMPAGMSLKVPWTSTGASVNWRTGEDGANAEMDPGYVWGADTVRPAWINGWVKISNEAMTAPGISIADELAMELVDQILRKIEYGVILGQDGGTDPSDGILNQSSVNTQIEMATPTLALLQVFIGQCIEDHEGAGDTQSNFLITTDAAAHVLKSAASATGANPWGDPTTGIPATVHGYRILTSPYAISTPHRLIMSPLGKVKVYWTGSFSVSFNDSLGWASNTTYMGVGTHADFSLGNPDMHHQAVYTALA